MRVKFYYIDEHKNCHVVNKKVRNPKNWDTFTDDKKIDYLMNRYYYETLILAEFRSVEIMKELEYITIDDVKYQVNHLT
jgi:hypothetical protein